MNHSFFRAKFTPPKQLPGVMRRVHLENKIQNALQTNQGLILLSAPAGYGKSTVVNTWLHSQADKPHTWISLDSRDNDPARFMKHWIVGLQQINDGLGEGAKSLLNLPNLPLPVSVMDELLHELYELDQGGVIILDDFHLISDSRVHEAMAHFIEYHPPSYSLIIATRQDPPFPLSRLRANGFLTEIRAEDLKFSLDEMDHFLNESMRLALDEAAIKRLSARTEGWAAGLQLAGLAIRNSSSRQDFIRDFSGTHRFIMDYLIDEVLAFQRGEIRDFLFKTARLRYFNADLCSKVTGLHNAAGILGELEKTNLFIVPMDHQRNWFRYHHLFAEMLCAQDQGMDFLQLHISAAEWFESNGFFEDAIYHYIEGSGSLKAARLIGEAAVDLLKRGESRTLLDLINALPREETLSNQALVAIKILCLVLSGKNAEANALISKFFSTSEKDETLTRDGRFLALQTWIASMHGGSDTERYAQQALMELGENDNFFRAFTLIALGTNQSWNGNLAQSTQAFQSAYTLSKQIDHPFSELGALANLAFNLWESGDMLEARALCQMAQEDYSDYRGKSLPVVAIIYAPLSSLFFESGDFDLAKKYADLGLQTYKRLFSNVMMGGDNEIVLARLAFLGGDMEPALALLSQMEANARKQANQIVVQKMLIVKTDLYLLNSDISEADVCINELRKSTSGEQSKVLQTIDHFHARLLIATGLEQQALEILEILAKDCQAKGYNRRLLGVQLSQAIAYRKSGNLSAAEKVFSIAVKSAAAEGYRTLFLPAKGRDTLPLLHQCKGAAREFVDSIFDLISEMGTSLKDRQKGLPDPLTDQQLRVLGLMVSGLSNQQIADELVISLGTAKWHVHNVLQKLGVDSRTQAIARAGDLGIA